MFSKLLRRSTVLLALLCVSTLSDNPASAIASEPAANRASEPRPVRVLIAYYSRSGNTEQFARGVAAGVERERDVVATVKKVEEVTKQDLEAADAIVLGCPTYFANIPGKMKVAIDDWNWKMKVDFTDKLGGAFATGAGQVGGKGHVVTSLLLFMINNRMIVAGPLYENAERGTIWAESGAAAMTGPLDPGVSGQELDGAHRLGQRMAQLAKRLRAPSRNELTRNETTTAAR